MKYRETIQESIAVVFGADEKDQLVGRIFNIVEIGDHQIKYISHPPYLVNNQKI